MQLNNLPPVSELGEGHINREGEGYLLLGKANCAPSLVCGFGHFCVIDLRRV